MLISLIPLSPNITSADMCEYMSFGSFRLAERITRATSRGEPTSANVWSGHALVCCSRRATTSSEPAFTDSAESEAGYCDR